MANSTQKWIVVDLENQVLGRAASRIAILLRGKDQPHFSPNVDDGGVFVIVLNARKVRLTGKKLTDKIYYRHTGFPGGMKEQTAGEMLERRPEEIIRLAVSGMLPKNKLSDHFMKKLKVYAGTEHPHTSQQPEQVTL